MKKIFLVVALLSLVGCATLMKVSYSKLNEPFSIEATRNYLPKEVLTPVYTIYEDSKWICNYKTETGDYICCLESYSTVSPWKYCLLVDENQNAFAFMDLGKSEYLKWSEGKQPLFKKR